MCFTQSFSSFNGGARKSFGESGARRVTPYVRRLVKIFCIAPRKRASRIVTCFKTLFALYWRYNVNGTSISRMYVWGRRIADDRDALPPPSACVRGMQCRIALWSLCLYAGSFVENHDKVFDDCARDHLASPPPLVSSSRSPCFCIRWRIQRVESRAARDDKNLWRWKSKLTSLIETSVALHLKDR